MADEAEFELTLKQMFSAVRTPVKDCDYYQALSKHVENIEKIEIEAERSDGWCGYDNTDEHRVAIKKMEFKGGHQSWKKKPLCPIPLSAESPSPTVPRPIPANQQTSTPSRLIWVAFYVCGRLNLELGRRQLAYRSPR